jgi:hypothetical protein
MIVLTAAAAALLLLQPASQKAPPKAAPAARPAVVAPGDLPVTVTYKGKGPVDSAHRVIVWLFSEANITSASRPLDHLYVTNNGETVTFKAVTAPVYVFAVYDDTGGYDGVSGPPPAGVPSATYRQAVKGPPAAVKGGAAVKFTFDDSERWSK